MMSNHLKKNLSIGDISYDHTNFRTSTTKNSLRTNIVDSSRYKSTLVPGSAKNTSKHSTNAESYMKFQTNTVLKSQPKFTNKLDKNINFSIKKANYPNFGQKQGQIQELMNMQEKSRGKLKEEIRSEMKHHVQHRNNGGLEDKYLEKSQETESLEKEDKKWESKEEEMQYLTSDSMTSLGSIPDEYDAFEAQPVCSLNQSATESRRSKQSKSMAACGHQKAQNYIKDNEDQENSVNQRHLQPLYESQNERGDLKVDTNSRNHETSSIGIKVKHTMNVPSMITHLKRKDGYLESLDIFLNENLQAISDLISIKKIVSSNIKELKKRTEEEKDNITKEETRGLKLEKDISRTLEENYCLEHQNEVSVGIVQRVRAKISEKYQQYEQEIEELYSRKQEIKEKVTKQIKDHADPVKRTMRMYKAVKIPKSGRVADKLTSNEYQLECLKKIMSNENNRMDQRLAVVREKTKLLNNLIKNEDSF